MNLMEYRAMKAQEESAPAEQPAVVEPVVETVTAEPTPPSVDTTPAPQTFDIDGQQVTLEELQKGYLRQSDYTKKTQDVARQAREAQEALELVERIKENPELSQQLNYDPVQADNQKLQQNYYDLLLQQEVQTLSTKYADFEVSEVLDFALEREMDNLEDAYLLNKSYKTNAPTQVNTPVSAPAIDVEALKAQIRAELLAEQNTATIITSGGSAPTPQAEVQLSEAQLRIARGMGMTPEEYVKWS
jgi:hypothetical protein